MRSFRATPRLTPRFPRRPVSADFAAALNMTAAKQAAARKKRAEELRRDLPFWRREEQAAQQWRRSHAAPVAVARAAGLRGEGAGRGADRCSKALSTDGRGRGACAAAHVAGHDRDRRGRAVEGKQDPWQAALRRRLSVVSRLREDGAALSCRPAGSCGQDAHRRTSPSTSCSKRATVAEDAAPVS